MTDWLTYVLFRSPGHLFQFQFELAKFKFSNNIYYDVLSSNELAWKKVCLRWRVRGESKTLTMIICFCKMHTRDALYSTNDRKMDWKTLSKVGFRICSLSCFICRQGKHYLDSCVEVDFFDMVFVEIRRK